MKERPILFSAPMVRAILAGTKTQTRRVVKDPGLPCATDAQQRDCIRRAIGCPYGQPGDRLWVREAWGVYDQGFDTAEESAFVVYRADTDRPDPKRWRPSIHMPRWASRITLEITDVRVQRLQDISEADADAEVFGGGFPHVVLPELFPDADAAGGLSIPECFRVLWESINGAGSWETNPWVWALTFHRVAP